MISDLKGEIEAAELLFFTPNVRLLLKIFIFPVRSLCSVSYWTFLRHVWLTVTRPRRLSTGVKNVLLKATLPGREQ